MGLEHQKNQAESKMKEADAKAREGLEQGKQTFNSTENDVTSFVNENANAAAEKAEEAGNAVSKKADEAANGGQDKDLLTQAGEQLEQARQAVVDTAGAVGNSAMEMGANTVETVKDVTGMNGNGK
eukprot:scaffold2549_cov104-Cylindrotheca_fusiformis.AAC.1